MGVIFVESLDGLREGVRGLPQLLRRAGHEEVWPRLRYADAEQDHLRRPAEVEGATAHLCLQLERLLPGDGSTPMARGSDVDHGARTTAHIHAVDEATREHGRNASGILVQRDGSVAKRLAGRERREPASGR